MTNYEYMKSICPEKLANFMCAVMEDLSIEKNRDACYVCPFYDKCDISHNGWLEWLKEEHDRH